MQAITTHFIEKLYLGCCINYNPNRLGILYLHQSFPDEDVELLRELLNGDGAFTEIPFGQLKLKDDTVPFHLWTVRLEE